MFYVGIILGISELEIECVYWYDFIEVWVKFIKKLLCKYCESWYLCIKVIYKCIVKYMC